MDEQQLQEMEAWISEAACFSECDEQDEAALWSLIAEVRRLQQQRIDADVRWEEFKAEVVSLRQQRDAALAEATTLRQALIAESVHRSKLGIHSGTEDAWKAAVRYADKLEAAEAARDAALAERDREKAAHELEKRAHERTWDSKKKAQDALTEARRVLKHVLSELKQTDDWGVVSELQAEIAAVLAQEEK